jgi:hypothetical protein
MKNGLSLDQVAAECEARANEVQSAEKGLRIAESFFSYQILVCRRRTALQPICRDD